MERVVTDHTTDVGSLETAFGVIQKRLEGACNEIKKKELIQLVIRLFRILSSRQACKNARFEPVVREQTTKHGRSLNSCVPL